MPQATRGQKIWTIVMQVFFYGYALAVFVGFLAALAWGLVVIP